MTDRAALLQLRGRLKAASGPDWQLDDALAQAILGFPPCGTAGARRYTGSLDASVTLLPDGWRSWLFGKGRTRPDEPAFGVVAFSDEAGTTEMAKAEHDTSLALAICLARVEYELGKADTTDGDRKNVGPL